MRPWGLGATPMQGDIFRSTGDAARLADVDFGGLLGRATRWNPVTPEAVVGATVTFLSRAMLPEPRCAVRLLWVDHDSALSQLPDIVPAWVR